MANLNKVMLIGRLTRDPEVRNFPNGGRVAKFGFAVNNRKKNQQTGQWEEDPVFLDCEAFNRGEFGKQADLGERFLQKGRQVFLEGHLKLDQWTSQEGQKRSRLVVVVDNMQFIDSRPDGQGGGANGGTQRVGASAPGKPPASPNYDEPPPEYSETPEFTEHPNDKDIPF